MLERRLGARVGVGDDLARVGAGEGVEDEAVPGVLDREAVALPGVPVQVTEDAGVGEAPPERGAVRADELGDDAALAVPAADVLLGELLEAQRLHDAREDVEERERLPGVRVGVDGDRRGLRGVAVGVKRLDGHPVPVAGDAEPLADDLHLDRPGRGESAALGERTGLLGLAVGRHHGAVREEGVRGGHGGLALRGLLGSLDLTGGREVEDAVLESEHLLDPAALPGAGGADVAAVGLPVLRVHLESEVMALALGEPRAEPVDEVVLERDRVRVRREGALRLDEEAGVEVHAEVGGSGSAGDHDVLEEAGDDGLALRVLHVARLLLREDAVPLDGPRVAVRGEGDSHAEEELGALGVHLVAAGVRGDDGVEGRVELLAPRLGVDVLGERLLNIPENLLGDRVLRVLLPGMDVVEDLLAHGSRNVERVHSRLLSVVGLEEDVPRVVRKEPVEVRERDDRGEEPALGELLADLGAGRGDDHPRAVVPAPAVREVPLLPV